MCTSLNFFKPLLPFSFSMIAEAQPQRTAPLHFEALKKQSATSLQSIVYRLTELVLRALRYLVSLICRFNPSANVSASTSTLQNDQEQDCSVSYAPWLKKGALLAGFVAFTALAYYLSQSGSSTKKPLNAPQLSHLFNTLPFQPIYSSNAKEKLLKKFFEEMMPNWGSELEQCSRSGRVQEPFLRNSCQMAYTWLFLSECADGTPNRSSIVTLIEENKGSNESYASYLHTIFTEVKPSEPHLPFVAKWCTAIFFKSSKGGIYLERDFTCQEREFPAQTKVTFPTLDCLPLIGEEERFLDLRGISLEPFISS